MASDPYTGIMESLYRTPKRPIWEFDHWEENYATDGVLVRWAAIDTNGVPRLLCGDSFKAALEKLAPPTDYWRTQPAIPANSATVENQICVM